MRYVLEWRGNMTRHDIPSRVLDRRQEMGYIYIGTVWEKYIYFVWWCHLRVEASNILFDLAMVLEPRQTGLYIYVSKKVKWNFITW